jgi:hypothetical protein
MSVVMCPLCGRRNARRACPALNQKICAVCCGTKRLTQIRCPSDCAYLAIAREHPPAVTARQQQRDLELIIEFVRDFNQQQSQLFAMTVTFLTRYQPSEFQPLFDADVLEAAAALASTFETASRGVIYEHRPASPPAGRLVAALKPVLTEAGQHGGTAFERDAGVVMRRIESAVAELGRLDQNNRRAFLDFLGRTMRKSGPAGDEKVPPADPARLILP